MREIKFRAWNKKIGEYLISENDIVGFFECVRLYDLSIEQFTGLRDKNRRDIYEGDILSYNIQDHNGGDHFFTLPVEVIGAAFTCSGDDIGCHDLNWIWGNDDEPEVIGNIHENPELLK